MFWNSDHRTHLGIVTTKIYLYRSENCVEPSTFTEI